MQVKTERGLIWLEDEYNSVDEAKENGYDYAFYSTELRCDVCSKCLDEKGYKHSFAIIKNK